MDFLQTIGKRVRARRLVLGMSQEALAERAGLHYTYIGQIERGEKNASIETMLKLCFALDTTLEKLFEKIGTGKEEETLPIKSYELFRQQPPEKQKLLWSFCVPQSDCISKRNFCHQK